MPSWRALLDTGKFDMRRALIASVILASALIGGFAVHRGSTGLLLGMVVIAFICLFVLDDGAFPWFLVAVAVAPWYPFISSSAVPPRVPQRDLVAAVALAPLLPWLWSLARHKRRELKPSWWPLFLGILYCGYAVIVYDELGGFKPMVDSSVAAFLLLGVTLLCARRFPDPGPWLAASFGGLIALIAMGLEAKAASADGRVGYFVGYPITFGALLVGLLPAALVFAARRSRLITLAVAAACALMLIWSQSRSSWLAVVVMGLVLALLFARRRDLRSLAMVAGVIAAVVAVIVSVGPLRRLVGAKLSSDNATSLSVTHRVWSLQVGLHQIGMAPVLGHGGPGYSAKLTENETGVSAIDNGYVSITMDMGIFGLIGVLVPVAIALTVLTRCLVAGRAPPNDLALALGILGMAVVTLFYDSFYWPSITLLMGGMAGVLSTRLGLLRRSADRPRPTDEILVSRGPVLVRG